MNNTIRIASVLVAVALVFAACADDYYMEGRIKTTAATEITSQSALLNGEIKIVMAGDKVSPTVATRGFMLGTIPNDFTRTINDRIGGEGAFSCHADNLLPNTKYYIRAYATIHYEGEDSYSFSPNNDTFYGNTIEFTTPD